MSEKDDLITMHAVGYVKNDITDPSTAREMRGSESRIVLNEEYIEGLSRIEDFEKLEILFLFHLSRDFAMIQKRCYDGELAGVFASRSPRRPNGIGVTVVELLKVNGNVLHVKGLDAVNGTPVLDIKPYIGL